MRHFQTLSARKSAVFHKRDSSTEKELALSTSALSSTSTATTPTTTLSSSSSKPPEPSKAPITVAFVRQTSKNELKGNDCLANVATDKTKNDINAEKPSATTPPAVEKSYLNSTDKVATGAHVEITRLLTTSSPTKTHPSVEPTSKSSTTTSPVHFVGGWKAPSPTKEISREDRKSLEDDKEDLTLLERVSSKDKKTFYG